MRIGIVGAGQLGRMLALAGHSLGANIRFFDSDPNACGTAVAPQSVAELDDGEAMLRFAREQDVVTFESEGLPVAALELAARHVPVFPPPNALAVGQDRLLEKQLFRRLGIQTADFAAIHDEFELAEASGLFGLPSILKTRRGGYDGRGQVPIRDERDLGAAWKELGAHAPILEGFVRFDRELSIVAVRGRDGNMAFYPLAQNHHERGCLRHSIAPAPDVYARLQGEAEELARRVLVELDYVGTLALELFQVGDRLIANEMAPRVHNSGHWTIEGAETSQFENHLRAISGLPLGATSPRGFSAMVNLLGTLPQPGAVLAIPGAHLHVYGKSPAPGRKLGHVTLLADDHGVLRERLDALAAVVPLQLPAKWIHSNSSV